ncbi:Panacea domain-containing protein [Kordia jejudonensis]|uniref:Panacea domain-containing protein n=1 Tax=Kordia jejudonensis TaxID=1348245 RepID=UPI00062981A3|nr:Panacea domain-containing protein [Kordia jejudonensis]
MSKFYTTYNPEHLSKIGHTIIFLAENIENLSKTKILKLLYILDELSIKKGGIPFLNLKYKVWKFGPVSEDIFIELSTEPTLLKNYIEKTTNSDGQTFIQPKVKFNDDEFSQNDIELLQFVTDNFGKKTAKELVSHTHRKLSPWYNTAKENNILELLINENISNSEYIIDLSQLVSHDERKTALYKDYLAYH